MSKARIVVGVIFVVALLSIPFAWALAPEGVRWSTEAKQQIALIELVGLIADEGDESFASSGSTRQVLDFLKEAREDPQVVAVVFRINSGGGSAAASQELYRAVVKLREAGKPVVVTMGDAAASGGYYAAAAADHILANPSTVTGSIGVIAQFVNAAGLAAEWGVSLETVATGPYKDVGNPTKPFTDDQRAVIQALVDDSLEQFVNDVARGRNLDVEAVRRIADGRVMTGRQAREAGLIDGFGGIEEAIEIAAELAGVEGEPEIVRYRKPVPWYARYLQYAVPWAIDTRLEVERRLLHSMVGQGSGIILRYGGSIP